MSFLLDLRTSYGTYPRSRLFLVKSVFTFHCMSPWKVSPLLHHHGNTSRLIYFILPGWLPPSGLNSSLIARRYLTAIFIGLHDCFPPELAAIFDPVVVHVMQFPR